MAVKKKTLQNKIKKSISNPKKPGYQQQQKEAAEIQISFYNSN